MEKFSWTALGLSVLAIVVGLALYNVYLKSPIENALPKISA